METAEIQRHAFFPSPHNLQPRSDNDVVASGPSNKELHKSSSPGGRLTLRGPWAVKNRSRIRSAWDTVRFFGVRWYSVTFIILLGCFAAFSYTLWAAMRQSSLPRGGQLPSSGAIPIHTGVLRGHITQLDLPNGAVNVAWIVDGCSSNATRTTPPCTNSDYFINANAWQVLHTGAATPDIAYRAENSGPNPYFDWYDPTVTTVVPMHTADLQLNWRRTDQAYPLDLYFFRTFYTSRFADTNQTASVGGVYLFGNIATFAYSVVSTSYPYGPTNYTSLDPQDRMLWTTDTIFTRSGSTKTFCFIIVATNWSITMAVAWLTWTTIVGRRKIARELYSVPLTALFAVPPLRGSMPGVPASNAMIDYVGTIPNVLVIGACTIMMVLSSLMRNVDGLYPLHGAGLDLTDLDSHRDD